MEASAMKTSEKHHRRRLVIAPPPGHPGLHSAVLNVECADDEDVQWLWTETPEGRFVSGYQVVQSDATSSRHRLRR
jgi:hypothetical protein